MDKFTCECRGQGSNPWSGKISSAMEQLGPCATASEPKLLSQELQLLKPAPLEPLLPNKKTLPTGTTTRSSRLLYRKSAENKEISAKYNKLKKKRMAASQRSEEEALTEGLWRQRCWIERAAGIRAEKCY